PGRELAERELVLAERPLRERLETLRDDPHRHAVVAGDSVVLRIAEEQEELIVPVLQHREDRRREALHLGLARREGAVGQGEGRGGRGAAAGPGARGGGGGPGGGRNGGRPPPPPRRAAPPRRRRPRPPARRRRASSPCGRSATRSPSSRSCRRRSLREAVR